MWYSHDGLAAATRAALAPLEGAFRGVVGVRDMLYDAGWLPSHGTRIPAISVGNLTVGGTGKTPVAAWVARELAARGARPAVVLRGYGDDEPLVHRTLNPDVPVFTGADRAAAISAAAASGANVAVLDDGFQHRAVHRDADLVLINADRWTGDVRLLPAGPWREPIESVRRATLIIVTRKAADDTLVDAVHARLSYVAPAIPRVGMRLEIAELVRANGSGDVRPLTDLAGSNVH
ncbi:MAG TPA: tetraacyldisaccharide 4'-kinase, partial [Gemmatimonadaceae bacterium]|nr:tetraacyldisaccharide 4'-kinase [Gemmatimonadaceae bacterium]